MQFNFDEIFKMNFIKNYCFLIVLVLFINNASAQLFTQTIRGTVTDKFSKQAIANVTLLIKNKISYNCITNALGEFSMQVPLGRYSITCTHINYTAQAINDIIVNSSKQVIINIELDEKLHSIINAITVKGNKPKAKALNEMSIISARQFTVAEANKYAGSLGDPARMAQNFAGVQSNGDKRNDIIIRGNSPLGLSWRAEGIEIPNPNHFSGIGTTGGSISILNNNNLSNSDFLTGAFAPQYGNALAGVFDLKLKIGNNQKRENLFQFGLNGAEIGSEGPLKIGNKSSYIINARYSTLEIFDALKINLGANATAKYRDITFKINIPTTTFGTFAFWGIGGYNRTISLSKNFDTTGTKLNPRPKGFDTYFDNAMAAVGLSYYYKLNNTLTTNATICYTNFNNQTNIDSLYNNDTQKFKWLQRNYNDNRLNTNFQINKKWNAQHQTQLGIYTSHLFLNINDSIWAGAYNKYFTLLAFEGNTSLNRAYLQHQFKLNNNITVVGGMHAMHFGFNNTKAIEPRASAKWQLNNKAWFSAGAGIHHQLQPFTTYFYNRSTVGNFKDTQTNKNLDFIKSKHAIIGFDYLPLNNYRIKIEAYYQQISNAAVETKINSYSTLNEGAFFYVIARPYCINKGEGYNRGLEFTLEKFFSKQFYFLTTASVYKSMYKGSDQVWRHSAFDGSWSFTALGGYEWRIKNNNTLNLNLKFAALGGRRHGVIDTVQSATSGNTFFKDADAFTQRFPNYYRPDIKISYRLNKGKVSHEFGVNIDNFINRKNVQSIDYDVQRKQVGYSYQNGLLPVVQYRLEF
jgi:Carboxypeptidase regulatory-like domain